MLGSVFPNTSLKACSGFEDEVVSVSSKNGGCIRKKKDGAED